MLTPSAIRQAIDEVEQATSAPCDHDGEPALRKLYTVYAQSVLSAHGIMADLESLCCQCCRACPPGACIRDLNRA
ncbi:hypothetical protein [Azospirillum griseum]|uniref:Uncharacterized protein n=1 Tax=Azospirillum griseum TaxID=2496639 RepID=A0A431VII5_9PROT|nr:hypothetical protein [Azospirillum griseum]RTR21017.1 hypothetical protein EJ903_09735 [Azospirillum griseum]